MSFPVYYPGWMRSSTDSLAISIEIPGEPLEAHSWIIKGVEPDIVIQLVGLVNSDIIMTRHMVVISRSPLSSKGKSSILLTLTQGARLYGVIKVLDAVISLHGGDLDMAIAWLKCPARGLGGEKPETILATSTGIQAVLTLVGQVKHGIVS